MSDIVKLKSLNKQYQQGEHIVDAVKDVTLTLGKGEFTALCGPSGSGKTSILNMIGGLDFPSSGRVIVDNTDLAFLSSAKLAEFRKYRIGFVFQSYNLIPVMTAYENVAFVLQLQGLDSNQINSRVTQILAGVGLAGMANRRPDQLSGGQQQRVAIARAIVTQPAIVLADEPTANVDSKTAESLLDLMAKLNQEQGVSFLFSTHDQQVIERAQRLITIQDGRVKTTG